MIATDNEPPSLRETSERSESPAANGQELVTMRGDEEGRDGADMQSVSGVTSIAAGAPWCAAAAGAVPAASRGAFPVPQTPLRPH